jgi:hypothetical protein
MSNLLPMMMMTTVQLPGKFVVTTAKDGPCFECEAETFHDTPWQFIGTPQDYDDKYFFFLFHLVCEAIDAAATPGLLCQPRERVMKQMECRLAGETEVLGENLPQCHFCPIQNPTWPDPGLNPGSLGGKPATNRLGCRYLPTHVGTH